MLFVVVANRWFMHERDSSKSTLGDALKDLRHGIASKRNDINKQISQFESLRAGLHEVDTDLPKP